MDTASRLQEMLAQLEAQSALPAIALGLSRVHACLERLGHPERRSPPVIHVAGTNGKGSTIATMRAMLEAAGKRVHTYTSPHLVRFHERITLAGEPVDDATLLHVLERVLASAGEDIPLTFFEATTLVAFVAFAEHPADVLLLEVGLGGRLDATNVVERPLACVITPIDYDHKEFLGDTLAAIAEEKGGIIKPGVPVYIAKQAVEAEAVLRRICDERGVHGLFYGQDWKLVAEQMHPELEIAGIRHSLPALSLAGGHQYMNAGLAYVTLWHLREALGLEASQLREGIAHAVWPARLQRLRRGALVEALGAEETLWLDGGHNPAAAQALAQWLYAQPAPHGMMVGMMARKDAEGFFAPFAPLGMVVATLSMGAEGYDAQTLAEAARRAGCVCVKPCTGPEEALAWLAQHGTKTHLIAGSLYLAGKILATHA